MNHWTCPNCRGEFPMEGPTLRDQFAMAALTGLLGAYNGPREVGEAVEAAYVCADEMLKERAKP